MEKKLLLAVTAISLALLSTGLASATRAAKALKVSRCAGPPNAEVVQAVDGRHVYEAWIGCSRGIGFARSTDGGRSFGPARAVRGSHRPGLHTWDPAIAVAADGTVYVAYMMGPREGATGSSAPMRPAVAVSHDHGRSFGPVSLLPVPASAKPNWGDREFVAVGRNGVVYVTWDYGPRRDDVRIVCPPTGSCYFTAGDFNAVLQKSSDGGRTWTGVAPISPGFPLGGAYSAPIVAEPDGTLDVLYWQHPTNTQTLAVSPGRQYFTSSKDGGNTWSPRVAVGAQAGTIGLQDWWIDGSLAVDPAGILYATWDTQQGRATPPGSRGRGTAASTGHGRCGLPRAGPDTCPRSPPQAAATCTWAGRRSSAARATGRSCGASPSATAGPARPRGSPPPTASRACGPATRSACRRRTAPRS